MRNTGTLQVTLKKRPRSRAKADFRRATANGIRGDDQAGIAQAMDGPTRVGAGGQRDRTTRGWEVEIGAALPGRERDGHERRVPGD